MEKIDEDLVDLEKLRFEFLRPLSVTKTNSTLSIKIRFIYIYYS